jgi:NADP-dependent 3-hydroxy acid dehydrogenase YdfG
LVNNAGLSMRSTIEGSNMDKVSKLFDVNVYGVLRMTKACNFIFVSTIQISKT